MQFFNYAAINPDKKPCHATSPGELQHTMKLLEESGNADDIGNVVVNSYFRKDDKNYEYES